MRMAVAIVPAQIMGIVDILRRNPPQALLHLVCYIHHLTLIGLNLENISISCSITVLS